jgi:hypothetical protein
MYTAECLYCLYMMYAAEWRSAPCACTSCACILYGGRRGHTVYTVRVYTLYILCACAYCMGAGGAVYTGYKISICTRY